MALLPIFKKAYWSFALLGGLYFVCLVFLTIPVVQNNAIYMQKLQLTWFNDLTKPEQFGFAKNQVTPLFLHTPDNETIFAWHVLPLGTYMKHREELVTGESGVPKNPLETKNLQLLMQDPEARLIIHFHGNAGTLGAGFRPVYMRSLSAGDPFKIHILAIDYRGFGLSSGTPSEAGLITDGLTAVRFAIDTLGISPSRIAIVGQSLGTGVTFAVAEALAINKEEVAAVIPIAAFSDLRNLILTYRIGGWFPILSPLRGYPHIQRFFTGYLYETWNSEERASSLVRHSPNLNLVLVHADNDAEIPWHHCDAIFAAVVNTTELLTADDKNGLTVNEATAAKVITSYGDESTLALWPGERSKGRRISQWVVKWGGHNEVVTGAGMSVIVAKAFGL